ncbi:MAG: cardiolipin synthase ClsB [Myxococcales bacterium]|nr:MAG: cardiolipin synthase ClsB [Myxococcales bacterium]
MRPVDISKTFKEHLLPGKPLLWKAGRVALFHDSDEALEAMLDAIKQAEKEIILEMYWIASDQTGWGFAEALMDKARKGLRVCVLFDAIGSWDSDGVFFDALEQAGCELEQYNPIAPWRKRFRLDKVNLRDHRKILVVDRKVAFTGGANLADFWRAEEHGGEGWRDDMVRIEGPAVLDLLAVSAHTWNRLSDKNIEVDEKTLSPVVPKGATNPLESRIMVLANFFKASTFGIRRAYLKEIQAAQSSILIANAYFVPGRKVSRALAKAAKRGVDVRILVPETSDVVAVYYASRRMFAWLMKRGVHIYTWPHSVLHSKSAVIDSRWTTVGTHNLDNRSIRMNLEVNVAIDDERIGQAMHKKILEDMASALEVSRRDWMFRPLGVRVAERVFYAFRWLL